MVSSSSPKLELGDFGDSYICIRGYDEGLSLFGEYYCEWNEKLRERFGEARVEGSGYAYHIAPNGHPKPSSPSTAGPPSLRLSKPPLVRLSAPPPVKTTTLSHTNIEICIFFFLRYWAI
ncbi:hypothetical protein CMV_008267 [Castanea mollissima]|uniref:Uncharacterized protein n=1 Tax=Castanea mollissima TaxID=60419 RepID=A0A8J4VRZ5_9ROSI|nr:hypothetical protein CMV_008267 [Castanea mollissima]